MALFSCFSKSCIKQLKIQAANAFIAHKTNYWIILKPLLICLYQFILFSIKQTMQVFFNFWIFCMSATKNGKASAWQVICGCIFSLELVLLHLVIADRSNWSSYCTSNPSPSKKNTLLCFQLCSTDVKGPPLQQTVPQQKR